MSLVALVIAIDGPSGSGKSTISRTVAAELGYAYLDTGAMYRAAAWWCEQGGVFGQAAQAVADHVAAMPLEINTDPEHASISVGGVNLDEAIRSTHISSIVSQVATNLAVRAIMQDLQREIIAQHKAGGIVAEGRDITTVVAPDADVRILLTASEEVRLARRAKDVHGSSDQQALAATADQVIRRDRDDSTVSNFTSAADGVIMIDTSELSFAQSLAAVKGVVKQQL